jgi:hypothetical protein
MDQHSFRRLRFPIVAVCLLALLPGLAAAANLFVEVWYQDTGDYDQFAGFCETGSPCTRQPGVEVCIGLQGNVGATCFTSTAGGNIDLGNLNPGTTYDVCLGDASWPLYRVNSSSSGTGGVVQAGRCFDYTAQATAQTKAMYVQRIGVLRAYALDNGNDSTNGVGNDDPLNGWDMSVTTPILNGVTGPPDVAGRASMSSFDIEIDAGANVYEVCQGFEPGWKFAYTCRGTCTAGEQLAPTSNTTTEVCVNAPLTEAASGAQNPDYTVIFGNERKSSGISVVKTVSTNGTCPGTDAPAPITVGRPVTYCYEVQNTGETQLKVTLVDDQLGSVSNCSSPDLLGSSEVRRCQATTTLPVGTITNTVTATGEPYDEEQPLEDGFLQVTATDSITIVVKKRPVEVVPAISTIGAGILTFLLGLLGIRRLRALK